ncbi:uncharacterized protein SAPINGB_P006474 [Magnusiomyces paraingens]|uniref:Repressor of RNA polymerase III transcription MAF1 n=1 Tax=Magnusiomyces paraingens TaxID=2606893 RepID=A0A5E8C632_9ASCO|nr:uncharacterized protein SAPINGB_P006474 [Saprochaete ingens]VVT58967.1 unnamed protein product [Saprochaete ingens]
MKFLELTDLDKLNSILKFETAELRVQGGVELFSTKPQSYDRKLYRTIDKHLNSLQQDALLQYSNIISDGSLSKSFSPPNSSNLALISPPSSHSDRSTLAINYPNEETNGKNHSQVQGSSLPPALAFSLNSSPFGPLDQAASRKAFGYLISVLNSTHPDHDFSSLQPSDFRREPSVTSVLNTFNNLIFSVGMPLPPTLWESLDDHIGLKECAVYSHTPSDSFLNDLGPGTLWCYMWFFFNKRRKRVVYLYLTATRTHELSSSLRREHERRRRDSSSLATYPESYDEEEYDLAQVSENENGDYDDDDAIVGDLELE